MMLMLKQLSVRLGNCSSMIYGVIVRCLQLRSVMLGAQRDRERENALERVSLRSMAVTTS